MLDVHGLQVSNENVIISFFFLRKKYNVLYEFLTYLIRISSDLNVCV